MKYYLAEDWKLALKADPTEWLLETENPSVRFLTLRDLLDRPLYDPEMTDAKESIMHWEKVIRILNKQKPEGHWESAEEPYEPKYKATYWQIMILSMLSLDRSVEQVNNTCEYIFGFQHQDGGFTSIKEEGAHIKYKAIAKRMHKRGKTPPPFKEWAQEAIREGEMTCLTGNICKALIQMGYADDCRVHRALDWLVEVQNIDGGWLCPYWKAHIKDKHGCFMGTITPLDAFSELPSKYMTDYMRETIERGVEFLLMHRLYKADHHNYRIINESWLKLSFPSFFYDILRGLSVVTKLGYGEDHRLDDAYELLLQKQNQEGQWILESTPSGRMQTNIEPKGKPSKWITLNALKVIKRIYQSREH